MSDNRVGLEKNKKIMFESLSRKRRNFNNEFTNKEKIAANRNIRKIIKINGNILLHVNIDPNNRIFIDIIIRQKIKAIKL